MRKCRILGLCSIGACLLSACSPRDFLTRRLATELIANSSTFKTPRQFWLRTGILSNKDYLSPEYLLMQHHGWISATNVPCPPQFGPLPCWDVMLTPSGVDAVRNFVTPEEQDKPAFNVLVAKRELLAVNGISKQGNLAEVDFTWRWIPLNDFGSALYSSDLHYLSTAGFRFYDDGWHVMQGVPRPAQSLDEALKNAEPAP